MTALKTICRRLIPAGAGTTIQSSGSGVMTWAHPRRCGDHRCVYGAIVTLWGSSPQVRGPRAPAKLTTIPIRLIPAGAGTTLRRELLPRRSRAHPRRCGDHHTVHRVGHPTRGSSPQVRGPRSAGCGLSAVAGLIPAGAGTTEGGTSRANTIWAHPRRCGDHTQQTIIFVHWFGSSPQVRGPR